MSYERMEPVFAQFHAPPRDMLIHAVEKNYELSVRFRRLISSARPGIRDVTNLTLPSREYYSSRPAILLA